jgi:hypothetical protein
MYEDAHDGSSRRDDPAASKERAGQPNVLSCLMSSLDRGAVLHMQEDGELKLETVQPRKQPIDPNACPSKP